jgi:hypothetical protein
MFVLHVAETMILWNSRIVYYTKNEIGHAVTMLLVN